MLKSICSFIVCSLLLVICILACGRVHAEASAPKELKFPKPVSNDGIFDPSIADAPLGSRLWMSYTAVDPSPLWHDQDQRVETTRIAFSDDSGKNWLDSGFIINTISELPFEGGGGSWVNETSSLIFDQSAPPNERWKLFWHHYLLVDQKPRFQDGWIAYKTGPTPESLKVAPEIKLFGAAAYQEVDNDLNGSTHSPVAGAPLIPFHRLHPNLDLCAAISEPGAMMTSSGMFMAVVCQKPNLLGQSGYHSEAVLMKCAAPCRVTGPESWRYVGKLLNDGLSAVDLFIENGQAYLIASPGSDDPAPGAYNGCNVYHFADLEKGQLEKNKFGQPLIVKSFSGQPHSFNGSCTYRSSALGAGFMLSQLTVAKNTPTFHIILSGKTM